MSSSLNLGVVPESTPGVSGARVSSQVDMQLWYSILGTAGPAIPSRGWQSPYVMNTISSPGFLATGEIFPLNHLGSNPTTPSCEAWVRNNLSMPLCPTSRDDVLRIRSHKRSQFKPALLMPSVSMNMSYDYDLYSPPSACPLTKLPKALGPFNSLLNSARP